jgi:SMP-30/Gluconolactonase/LRE-like region
MTVKNVLESRAPLAECPIWDPAAAIALVGENRLLVALRDRLALVNLDDGSVEPLQRAEFAHSDTRFNDGKCDGPHQPHVRGRGLDRYLRHLCLGWAESERDSGRHLRRRPVSRFEPGSGIAHASIQRGFVAMRSE